MSASVPKNEEGDYEIFPDVLEKQYGFLADVVIDGGEGGTEPSTVIDCTDGEMRCSARKRCFRVLKIMEQLNFKLRTGETFIPLIQLLKVMNVVNREVRRKLLWQRVLCCVTVR